MGSIGSFGFMMVASVVIGLVGGHYLDKLLGLENCFVIVGAIIGIIAGFVEFVRLMKVLLESQEKEKDKR